LWTAAHVPPTGHVVALILFGGMALLSLVGMLALDRRARRRLGERKWLTISRHAPLLPFAGLLDGGIRFRAAMLWPMAAAALLYGWLLIDGHSRFTGPDPLAWF
jgi:uncharacterized membrane protein